MAPSVLCENCDAMKNECFQDVPPRFAHATCLSVVILAEILALGKPEIGSVMGPLRASLLASLLGGESLAEWRTGRMPTARLRVIRV